MSITVLAHHPRRRADHGRYRCDDCGGRIPAGDRYSYQRCAGDGHVWTWREHALCRDLYTLADVTYGIDDYEWSTEEGQEELAEWWRQFAAVFAPGAGGGE